jgi:hypothetical protein
MGKIQSFKKGQYINTVFILTLFLLFDAHSLRAQVQKFYEIKGKVLSKSTNKPIEFVTVAIPLNGVWTNTNVNGGFNLKKVNGGKVIVKAQILGYVSQEVQITLDRDTDIVIQLEEDNLKLATVEVNAKKGSDLATSFVMDRQALDHLQMLQVTDIGALLPGGKTNTNQHLATTAPQRLSVNGTANELGNATFGVGLEIDGLRISNNSFRDGSASNPTTRQYGPDVKNVSTTNIESVEVITGLPSVEFGDMTNGMVKINTRKGVSPYLVEMSTRPNSKLVALSKGLNLGETSGVLNLNVEHTKSVADLASPFKTYDRNSLSLNYNNTFNKENRPITLNFGVTGNLGGYNSENDPDLFTDTYTKQKDDALRLNFSAKWLLNLPWITNLEASAAANYNNSLSEESTLKNTTASQVSIRTMEDGYHVGDLYENNPNAPIILIPRGLWHQKQFNDSRSINYNGRLKGNWSKKIGESRNNVMLGFDYSVTGNNGVGIYFEDLSTAPTWRPYPYKNESFVKNYAAFLEDALTVPIGENRLQLVAGIRSEITDINGSEYGAVNSWSPRVNAKYTFWQKKDQLINNIGVKLSWGKTIKLPSFDALYPTPLYRDVLSFSPGTDALGNTFYAYYNMPRSRVFNPKLKWQSNVQKEIAVNFDVKGTKVFISASDDRTDNPYVYRQDYTPYYYKLTSQANLQSSAIPAAARLYSIDKQSGVVTVSDNSGVRPAEQLGYTDMYAFNADGKYENGSAVTRRRINWIVDFQKIEALKTSLRVDGNYYYYKGLEETTSAYMPNATQNMANGLPYKYIGYFIGGGNLSNGSINKSLNMNFTVTTHIPAIRLVVSARLEGTFYRHAQSLSESSNGSRAYVIDNRDSYEPSSTETDIYGGDRFVAAYPKYYVSLDDLNTQIPFLEKFLWAKDNDVALYNELAKMIIRNNNNYIFNKSTTSAYYSANLAVTKEIGKFASLSFFANNFFNNMGKVQSRGTETEASLFGSSYIPAFNYGASLRLKF